MRAAGPTGRLKGDIADPDSGPERALLASSVPREALRAAHAAVQHAQLTGRLTHEWYDVAAWPPEATQALVLQPHAAATLRERGEQPVAGAAARLTAGAQQH